MTSEEGWVDITGVATPLSVSKDSIQKNYIAFALTLVLECYPDTIRRTLMTRWSARVGCDGKSSLNQKLKPEPEVVCYEPAYS